MSPVIAVFCGPCGGSPVRDPLDLLGAKVASPVVGRFFEALGGSPVADEEEELEQIYWSFREGGVCLLTTLDRTIFLYSDGVEGYSAYTGPLPLGLSFDHSRDDAHLRLGQPTWGAEPQEVPPLGMKGAMDRYDRQGHSVHVEYSPDTGLVRLVTLMASDAVPGGQATH